MPILTRFIAAFFLLITTTVPVAARLTTSPCMGDRLAYVFGGKLYIDGTGPRKALPGPGKAFHPAFSYDGQWLAWVQQTATGTSQLWLAHADGSSPYRIAKVDEIDSFAWSPTADVLAVQEAAIQRRAPVMLMGVDGTTRMVQAGYSRGLLWSSDGQTLAITTESTTLHTRITLVRGNSRRSYAPPGVDRIDPIILAGWWPGGHGILFWQDHAGCFSCIADGTQLVDFDLRTGKARSMGRMLIYGDWVAASGNRVLVVKGSDRSAFYSKHLALCGIAKPCMPLLGTVKGKISVDPTWLSTGGQIAFVVAPAWNTSGTQSAAKYHAWLHQHVLWIANANGSGAHPVGTGVPHGAESPQWTRDGRGILFVKDGALWINPHLGFANAHLIARLVPANSMPDWSVPAYQGWYYGHMDWHELYAWY